MSITEHKGKIENNSKKWSSISWKICIQNGPITQATWTVSKKVTLSFPNKKDPTDFHISPSPVANKTERTSPCTYSTSLLLQIDTPSNNSFLWGYWKSDTKPCFGPNSTWWNSKGFYRRWHFDTEKWKLMLRENLKSKKSKKGSQRICQTCLWDFKLNCVRY